MTFFTTLLLIWIVSAPLSYLLVRRDFREEFGGWTRFDQLFGLSISILTGPIALFMFTVQAAVLRLSKCEWANKEAKW